MPGSPSSVRAVKIAVVLAGVALIFSLVGTIQNAVNQHNNCQKIEVLKATEYKPLKEAYEKVRAGENDYDYLRIYGSELVEYKGKKIERWKAKKDAALRTAEKQLEKYASVSCQYFFAEERK